MLLSGNPTAPYSMLNPETDSDSTLKKNFSFYKLGWPLTVTPKLVNSNYCKR
jgi:hypothetical protein